MSLIKANAVQVGQSPTATQNFTLAVPSSPDGTIKLARGNAGATTQDVLNVSNAGVVSFPQGLGNISNSTAIATGSTTARSLANRFADVVNVKDFGAVGDGVADDTAAFQAAYNSALSGQAIYIPYGNYIVSSLTTTSKQVTWVHGKYNSALNIVLKNNSITLGPILNIEDRSGESQDFATQEIGRFANYTGGTGGYVNSALRAKTVVQPGTTNYEWTVLGLCENYGTAADNSENVAGYFQARKFSTGKTFGLLSELIDYNANPVLSSVSQEVDIRSVGNDSNQNRIGIHLVAASWDGNSTVVDKGILISAVSSATVNQGIEFGGTFTNYIKSPKFIVNAADGYIVTGPLTGTTGVSTAALTTSKSSGDGLDLYRGYTDGVLQIKIEQNGTVRNVNGVYGTISDQILKENITDATPKLDDLKKVRVVNYNLKNDSNKTKMLGVVAQELEEIFPNLVDEDGDGIKSVKTSIFIPILIKALQEQQKQIEELSAKVEALESK